MVRRVYVEKKKGYDSRARALVREISGLLGFTVEGARVLCRYDIEGVDEEVFKAACEQVFSEPAVDNLYLEEPPELKGQYFAVEALPGQYDQRADSAEQCVQLITMGSRPLVRCATVYAFEGLDELRLAAIKKMLINPVESREASMDKPDSLELDSGRPDDVEIVAGFCSLSDEKVALMHERMGFAMTAADLAFCRDYFASEKRDPTITELKVIDTYWSDHCRHTTFLTELTHLSVECPDSALKAAVLNAFEEYMEIREELYGENSGRPITLMDIATIGAKKLVRSGVVSDIDQSEEINACSIKVDVDIDGQSVPYLIMFKNETHNHPTEIEPFGGAATCLGGAIRDPLSGRSYVYQAMRVTGSADPRRGETPPGKLPQRAITTGAAAGYSSYGNQIGLATGQVREIYHEGYRAKRLEIGAVVGAAPAQNVVRERPSGGDAVILIGGRTGRDGIGGATGSSKAHTETSKDVCGAEVQKGNPITERKLQRLFRNPEFSKLVLRCNDFGAGGVCVAIGELADGVSIDLDSVKRKYDSLDGTELAISESQERMAVVVRACDVEKAMALASDENLESAKVAEITSEPVLKMNWRSKTIVEIKREFLDTNGVRQHAHARINAPTLAGGPFDARRAVSVSTLAEALSDLNNCSQKGLVERFDSTIGARTLLMPHGGAHRRTPAACMASLVPAFGIGSGESRTATLMSFGFDPNLSQWSPFHGAVYAVVHSLAKIVACGGNYLSARLSFQEYFERLGKNPDRWGKPAAALLGALQAQLAFGAPAIGGKDSMSGSFDKLDVPPTLVSFALAPVEADRVRANEFSGSGNRVVLFEAPHDGAKLPIYDIVKANFAAVENLLSCGRALSAAPVDSLIATVSQCCFGNGVGFAFSGEADLFSPMYGSIIVEMPPEADLPSGASELGYTTEDRKIRYEGVVYNLDYLQSEWEGALEEIFPAKAEHEGQMNEAAPYAERAVLAPSVNIIGAAPRAIIPVFPGTNCEDDTARALERAGAKAEILVLKNRDGKDILDSAKALVGGINRAQMLIIPGGFSGGDEPDGSGKFITAVLRSPDVMDALHELLDNRKGLVMGICNGFQALIKLGLLPYGKICEQTAGSPTLIHNDIGRHVSRIVKTRVTSVLSPWLALCEPGEVHDVVVSHGEGKFIASSQEIDELFAKGQVAFQYVDANGVPSMDIEHNPNGSLCAVEGLTSPDGRVLGKMGHSERIGSQLYKNCNGNYDQKLFESGVQYFK